MSRPPARARQPRAQRSSAARHRCSTYPAALYDRPGIDGPQAASQEPTADGGTLDSVERAMRMSPYSMRPGDASAIKGVKINRNALRRAWGFAGPYRGMIVLFLLAIIVSAILGVLPPLLFR